MSQNVISDNMLTPAPRRVRRSGSRMTSEEKLSRRLTMSRWSSKPLQEVASAPQDPFVRNKFNKYIDQMSAGKEDEVIAPDKVHIEDNPSIEAISLEEPPSPSAIIVASVPSYHDKRCSIHEMKKVYSPLTPPPLSRSSSEGSMSASQKMVEDSKISVFQPSDFQCPPPATNPHTRPPVPKHKPPPPPSSSGNSPLPSPPPPPAETEEDLLAKRRAKPIALPPHILAKKKPLIQIKSVTPAKAQPLAPSRTEPVAPPTPPEAVSPTRAPPRRPTAVGIDCAHVDRALGVRHSLIADETAHRPTLHSEHTAYPKLSPSPAPPLQPDQRQSYHGGNFKKRKSLRDSASVEFWDTLRKNKNHRSVKYASVDMLVARLVVPGEYIDDSYRPSFLLVYRELLDPEELFDELCLIYDEGPPENIAGLHILDTIRLNVIVVLNDWISHHFYDFENFPLLLAAVKLFLESQKKSCQGSARVSEAIDTLEQQIRFKEKESEMYSEFNERWLFGPACGRNPTIISMNSPPHPAQTNRSPPSVSPSPSSSTIPHDVSSLSSLSSTTSTPPLSPLPPTVSPSPLVSKGKPVSITSVHAHDMARQLTLRESAMFNCVKASEFVGMSWTSPFKDEAAPNIMKMISHFNKVSSWVTYEVVKQIDNLKARAAAINYFLKLAKECRRLGNFNGVMEILAGLQSSSVLRLKKSWASVKKKRKDDMKEYCTLMSALGSYARYRSAIKAQPQPCVPYLGVTLTDLTFIEEGNPDFFKAEDMKLEADVVNFAKFRMVASVIMDVGKHQTAAQCPYPFEFDNHIQCYLARLPAPEEEELYSLSKKCEFKVK